MISVEDLSGSVFLWHRDNDRWAAPKVITIPAEPPTPRPPTSPWPAAPDGPGQPRRRRADVTNSRYGLDDSFTPRAWGLDGQPGRRHHTGGLAADPRLFPNGQDFRGLRVHQTRLQGGDASSDASCHTP